MKVSLFFRQTKLLWIFGQMIRIRKSGDLTECKKSALA